jgi:tripartite-type tricarboxylate transporter receptor subunit TctC
MTELLGGHIDLMFATLPSALGHVKNGELRAIAIGSSQRVSDLPNVPTISENGVKDTRPADGAGCWCPRERHRLLSEKSTRTSAKYCRTRN